jgi:hypothetical protein
MFPECPFSLPRITPNGTIFAQAFPRPGHRRSHEIIEISMFEGMGALKASLLGSISSWKTVDGNAFVSDGMNNPLQAGGHHVVPEIPRCQIPLCINNNTWYN